MRLCDSHAHLTDPSLYPQVEALLARAHSAKVDTIINIATDAITLERGLELVQRHPNVVYQAFGVHPHDAEKEGAELFPLVTQHAEAGHLVAIGETGLDYYYTHSSKEIQQQWLSHHLQLALRCNLPVIIHCREAFSDFFRIVDRDYRKDNKWGLGVLHCFTGTLAEARQGLERGFYISISGIVTFKKSEELRVIAKEIPLDKLLIETDAPFLAPQSQRGKQNEPAFVVETAEVIAAVRGISLSELAESTHQNAYTLFSL